VLPPSRGAFGAGLVGSRGHTTKDPRVSETVCPTSYTFFLWTRPYRTRQTQIPPQIVR
jgi:hypothetical protein